MNRNSERALIMPTAFGAVTGATAKSPAGLLLAAGAGHRMGAPKALVGDWLTRGIDVLTAAECGHVVVVLGAALQQARALLHERSVCALSLSKGASTSSARIIVAVAADWSDGISASLRAGISAIPAGASAAVVTLVDLPDVGETVVRRVLERGAGPATLTRATYHGRPGHPVVLGRAHWPGILAAANGDVGARAYFDQHAPELVECADLASGRDVDRPDEVFFDGGVMCAR